MTQDYELSQNILSLIKSGMPKIVSLSCTNSRRNSFELSDELSLNSSHNKSNFNPMRGKILKPCSRATNCSNLLMLRKSSACRSTQNPPKFRPVSTEISEDSLFNRSALTSTDNRNMSNIDAILEDNNSYECGADNEQMMRLMRIRIGAQAETIALKNLLVKLDQFEEIIQQHAINVKKFDKVQRNQFRDVEFVLRFDGLISQKLSQHLAKFIKSGLK